MLHLPKYFSISAVSAESLSWELKSTNCGALNSYFGSIVYNNEKATEQRSCAQKIPHNYRATEKTVNSLAQTWIEWLFMPRNKSPFPVHTTHFMLFNGTDCNYKGKTAVYVSQLFMPRILFRYNAALLKLCWVPNRPYNWWRRWTTWTVQFLTTGCISVITHDNHT